MTIEIVGSSGARDIEGVRADSRALRAEATCFEVRLDRFEAPQTVDLVALRAAISQRAIFTLRPTSEGGGFAGSRAARIAMHVAADAAGFHFVDLEEDIAKEVQRGRARRIVSAHFDAIPADVAARVEALAAGDADIVKLAARARDPAEALAFVHAAHSTKRRVVAIAMGEAGRYLRPLAAMFDMPLLYAAIHPSRKTADGQITVEQAIDLYRAQSIDASTRIFAVAGGDVRRSASPRVHNAIFAATRTNAVYLDLSADEFEAIGRVARELPFAGLSVTQPFKRDALAFADSVDATAQRIGAANTLLRRDDGTFAATNTDAPGFSAAIDLALRDPEACRHLTVGHSFQSISDLRLKASLPSRRKIEHVLIYGTGGAARAAAFAMQSRGARVYVTGREFGAVTALVLGLGSQAGGTLEGISEGRARSLTFDLLVKAVPDLPDDEVPLDPTDFARNGFAADVVYQPIDTAFLRAARAWGRIPIPGMLMFAAQAALQAEAFIGAPPEAMLPVIATALAAR